MKNYTEEYKYKMCYYINPETGRVTYNEKCKGCQNNCKQSYRAEIVKCNFCAKGV